MDTSFAVDYGATELSGVLTTLAESEKACACLRDFLEPEFQEAAIEMLKRGRLDGTLGDRIHDYLTLAIGNDAVDVWSGRTFDPDDEENTDAVFPIGIREYCGVFFVWSPECENAGYFLSKEDALQFLEINWENVRKNDEEA